MKKIIAIACAILLATLTGCNTVKGVGQDVQKAGSAIEKSVK